ncbi:MAG: hypothetical protein ACYDAM_04920 [Leptospirales bacterium]
MITHSQIKHHTGILWHLPAWILFFLFLGGLCSLSPADAKNLDLLKAVQEDTAGIYLSHIPHVFSLSVISTRPGMFYSGTISDPGGEVRILSRHAPPRELVIERVARDRIRFTLAPVQNKSPDMISFQTKTGCFTLLAWQSPPRKLPIIHLNGYTPSIRKMPVIFCGQGLHVRYEWQGPYPGK